MSEEQVVDAAGESAVSIETPDHTPEVEIDSEAVVEETPATEEETQSVNESDDPLPEVIEDFSDLDESFIPPLEQIDKLRIPKEERERIKKVVNLANESTKQLEEIGGEFGVKAFAPFAKILTKASATAEEVADAVQSIGDANPRIAAHVALTMGGAVLQDPELADHLLMNVLGDNASLANIKSLLALDKEGLVDKDSAWLGTEPSQYLDLQRENEALKRQLEAKEAPQVDTRAKRAVEEFETDFHGEIPQALKATFEKVGWEADSPLTKLVTEILTFRLKSDPKFQDTGEFIKTTGMYRNGEKRAPLAEANLRLLKNQAVAQGQELVRLVQAAFRQQSEKSRNKIIAQKQQSEPKQTVPQPLPNTVETFEQRQERLRKQYLASVSG